MKLIFMDIDGTLTIPGHNTPPESAVRAIKSAQKLGNKVFICTGRGMCMLEELLPYGFDGVIALAGGYILCDGKVIYECPMTEEQVDDVLSLLHEHGVFCTIESNFDCYGDEKLRDFYPMENVPASFSSDSKGDLKTEQLSLITETGTEIIEKRLAFFRENMIIQPMDAWKKEPIYKVVIFCEHLEQLEPAKAVYEQDFDFCAKHMDYLGFVNGELINRKFDKGQAIIKVCEALGVSIENTYGFGDGQNDFPMMQVVGTSVCMENGEESLKKICDYICPSVEEDGIAKAFAKLGLCE